MNDPSSPGSRLIQLPKLLAALRDTRLSEHDLRQVLREGVGLDDAEARAWVEGRGASFTAPVERAAPPPPLPPQPHEAAAPAASSPPSRPRELAGSSSSLSTRSLRELNDALRACVDAGQWRDALAVLDVLIDRAEDPALKVRLLKKAVDLSERHLSDAEDAPTLALLERLLDEDSGQLEAFARITQLLDQARDWLALERGYRRMIQRVNHRGDGADRDTLFLLWHQLGELYRTRLDDRERAVAAFEQARALHAGNPQVRETLTGLYASLGRHDEALQELRRALHHPAGDSRAALEALFKGAINARRYDEAWCVANVLATFGGASDEAQALNERYRPAHIVSATGRFDASLWAGLRHPDADPRISAVMALLAVICVDLYAWDLKRTWGLTRQHRLDPTQPLTFCKTYRAFSEIIGPTPAPDLYLDIRQPIGLRHANVAPPAVVVGCDLMQDPDPLNLAFTVARALALCVPSHYLAGARLPVENLKVLMLGAIAANAAATPADLPESFQTVIKSIQRSPPPMRVDLGRFIRPFTQGGVEADLNRWLGGVEHTADRVGLLLCGDLETALRAIQSDTAPVSTRSPQTRAKDLRGFALSEAYLTARAQLGVSIG